MAMKSHPLIDAARACVESSLDPEAIPDHLDHLESIMDIFPDEPLAIVPCAWLVEAAEAAKAAAVLFYLKNKHAEMRQVEALAAKLRGAVGAE